jgi:glycosyltransferase involved in cell wall biosynthesis
MELISCITPTFNRKDLLARAIQSCIDQTYRNWEMIIVDDGSKDDTDKLVEEIAVRDSRVRFYRNPGKGANAARNFGIRKSAGDYIVFLDDDDEHLPHRFESQLNAIKKSGVKFILSGFQVRDLATGKIIGTDYARSTGMGAGHGVRWMIARELLLKAGLFDEEMPSMQEVELSYRIADFSNYAFHDSIVMTGGVNHASITRSKEKMINGRLRLLGKHGDRMPRLEAAWWNYVVALDYLGR